MGRALDNLRSAFGADTDRKSLVVPSGVGPMWQLNPPDGDPFLSPYYTMGSADLKFMGGDWGSLVSDAYKANGIVFACIVARMMAFSEARFQWRTFTNGRPSDLFGSTELALLEEPWPGGTTGELLGRMEQDISTAGNFYATTIDDAGRIGNASVGGEGRRIIRLRPNLVEIVIGSPSQNPYDISARVVGYRYTAPQVSGTSTPTPVLLLPDEVCHYSPIPDPETHYRGMSWLTPIVREIQADKAATTHKLKFFENGATPNLAIKYPLEVDPEDFQFFRNAFNADHKGANNAYRTLHIGGGADPVPLSGAFQQLDFKNTQGAGETRIAAAAGVPPVWVGFSEGLQGSSLNKGNFGAAKDRFADATIRPLWRMAAASLQVLVPYATNPAARLWYDARDVAFLREDSHKVAEIAQMEALTIRQLIDAGFEPDAVISAVQANDWTVLKAKHTGLFSVQLQAPVTGDAGTTTDPALTSGVTDGP
jgi:phage portal protein BeeE